jgi:hypothetical protein
MPFSSLNWRQYKVGYKKEAWTSIVATFNNAYSNLFYWRVTFSISLMAINTSTNTALYNYISSNIEIIQIYVQEHMPIH